MGVILVYGMIMIVTITMIVKEYGYKFNKRIEKFLKYIEEQIK